MNTVSGSIARNLDRIRTRIERAAGRAGRPPDEITLVAISKTFPAEAIRQGYEAGVRHFGENRVQEWETKHPQLQDLAGTWHLVGHLQSNKAPRAARLFHAVDSVDSEPLARRLDRFAEQDTSSDAPHKPLRVLLEVRMDPEPTKTGIAEAQVTALARAVLTMPHLALRGLMCVPPYFEEPEKVRPYFRRLRELRDSLVRDIVCELPVLSMGMSNDFEVAIQEGATEVRLGTAVFGSRPPVDR